MPLGGVLRVKVREFMAREYEHIRRFLSHKDPNYMHANIPHPESAGAPGQHPGLYWFGREAPREFTSMLAVGYC